MQGEEHMQKLYGETGEDTDMGTALCKAPRQITEPKGDRGTR